ncbi:MAG TPA: cobalamin-dependent protein [Smithellaceae bacterium]|nr:cobalamin-dependent protein [Smithellaceae bacterium]HPE07580.1 cobalamin-dependent protein [Smithellaceae bacterium]HRY38101.1 cobalamin-dependent protein [Smithellaceae bacterium]
MNFLLIYPKWEKLDRQTRFTLPPHGPVVMAAALPADVDVQFIDENVEPIDFDAAVDFVGVSMMLTAQVKRGWEIADAFRARGIKVICGGIATMLHAEESELHADAVYMGEAEGRMEQVFADFKANKLQKVYNYMQDQPPIKSVGTARRSILNRAMYNYRGVQMVDLVHASRGCRFNCYPCAVRFLGGRSFRPRPYDKVIEELAGIDNNRLFIVDNSLAQDKDWEMGLFREMIPLKKKWCSHPIDDDDQVLDLAAQAGAWFVYQAIFDSSDYIRDRIKRYHDYGIGVEGSILLGLDYHTEDYIKRWMDFLLEIELDMAEFTVLTPFPHTRTFDDLNNAGRIFSRDWNDYTCGKVVFQPKLMSPEKLQEMYAYCWDRFYEEEPQNYKMFRMLKRVVEKEKADGTFKPRVRL